MRKTATPKQLIALLKKNGFRLTRSNGSHFIFRHRTTNRRIVVPYHLKELPRGTFHAILKQAGISEKEI